jgi:hypothetical protein
VSWDQPFFEPIMVPGRRPLIKTFGDLSVDPTMLF